MPVRRRASETPESQEETRSTRRSVVASRTAPEPQEEAPKQTARRASASSSGWDKLKQKAEERETAKAVLDSKVPVFKMKSGEMAIIQICHDEPIIVETHRTKNKYGRYEVQVCQKETQRNCKMCEAGMATTTSAAFKVLDFRGRWDKNLNDYSWDEPLERLLWASQKLAMQFYDYSKRKGPLSECVIEISRSGSGPQDTAYNLSPAFTEDGKPEEPYDMREFDFQEPSIEDIVKPLSDDELEAIGFESAGEYGESSNDKPTSRGASRYSRR